MKRASEAHKVDRWIQWVRKDPYHFPTHAEINVDEMVIFTQTQPGKVIVGRGVQRAQVSGKDHRLP